MLVALNLIESDQLIVGEIKLYKCKHDPAVMFKRRYQGEVNYFYLKMKQSIFSHTDRNQQCVTHFLYHENGSARIWVEIPPSTLIISIEACM
jgi:hypothetical protein